MLLLVRKTKSAIVAARGGTARRLVRLPLPPPRALLDQTGRARRPTSAKNVGDATRQTRVVAVGVHVVRISVTVYAVAEPPRSRALFWNEYEPHIRSKRKRSRGVRVSE